MENLEGMEVMVKVSNNVYTGLITGYDRYIGITIQDKYDLNNYLLCAHFENSPLKKQFYDTNGHTHQEIFDKITSAIKEGIVDIDVLEDWYYNGGLKIALKPPPSAESCPFGQ